MGKLNVVRQGPAVIGRANRDRGIWDKGNTWWALGLVNRTKVVEAHTGVPGWGRNRDEVSVTVYLPICANVTNFSPLLF